MRGCIRVPFFVMSSSGQAPESAQDLEFDHADYTSSKASRFRFKSRRKRSHHDDEDGATHQRSKRSRTSSPHSPTSHYHASRRSRRRPRTPPDDPTLYDSSYLPNTRSTNYLDPDTAFRESLFDALADDEGAAFWEGVYGQPIHTYPDVRTGPEGELERMSDEEYTAYVRAKMYEKTHQHIIEERERREEEKKRRERERRETPGQDRGRSAFERDIEESLRRGEDRKRRAQGKERWERYLEAWKSLGEDATPEDEQSKRKKKLRDRVPWPVHSSRFADLGKAEIEAFFHTGASVESAAGTKSDLLSILKAERVRWHPDKMQQRLGSQGIDDATIKAVTAVFQVVDRMWTEEREKAR